MKFVLLRFDYYLVFIAIFDFPLYQNIFMVN